jgi:signal transduction histidine kinase
VPANVRAHLVLQLVAAAAASAALLLGVGLPLAAAHASIAALAGAFLLSAALFVVVGAAILFRRVARPVERMLAAAEQLSSEGLPALGPPGEAPGPGLPRAALAFERTVSALAEERARVAEKVAALERANRELGGARESLVRAERLATLGRIAAGIAHEVGNPLGAITGYAELARDRLAAMDAGIPRPVRGRISPTSSSASATRRSASTGSSAICSTSPGRRRRCSGRWRSPRPSRRRCGSRACSRASGRWRSPSRSRTRSPRSSPTSGGSRRCS